MTRRAALNEAARTWFSRGGARRTAPGETRRPARPQRPASRPRPDLRLLPGAAAAWLLTWGALVLPAEVVLTLGGLLSILLLLALLLALAHLRQQTRRRGPADRALPGSRLSRSRRGRVPGERRPHPLPSPGLDDRLPRRPGALWADLDRLAARAVATTDLRAGRRRGRRVALTSARRRRESRPGRRRSPGRYRARTTPVTWGAGLLLALALTAPVTAITGVRMMHRQQDPLTAAAARQSTVTFEGRVSGDPKKLTATSFGGEPLVLVRLKLSRIEVGGKASGARRTLRSSAQLVVFGSGTWGDLVAGQRVGRRRS